MREDRVSTTAPPAARVERFMVDWGSAWARIRDIVDREPLRALDEWDAAMDGIDARHFVHGESCGAQGAFSRVQSDHDPSTETVVDVAVEGDRASVRTSAPHPSFPRERTSYEYLLVRSGGDWRIARLTRSTPPSEGSGAQGELRE